LLDVFRITHRKLKLRKEAIDLANLVRLTAEDHRSSLEGTGVRLLTEVPADPVWVSADRTRLVQVLSNLLFNAAKFTNPGDNVAVHLDVDPSHQRACVRVQDTGIGISPHMLTQIFDHFSQDDRGVNNSGLGLGLALVKGLVEFHGGQVSAHSDGVGRGTEVSFWLPLGIPPKKPAPATAPLPVTRGLRILIVEDNPDTAKTLQVLLERHGHEARMAHTGEDGMEITHSWLPEVMLCDLGLPEMDGYEVARAVRADPRTAALRLIAISGYGQDEDRQHSEEAGYDLHLTKPIDPVDLLRLLAVLKVGS
jgi:CheY-like chemotaxis protein